MIVDKHTMLVTDFEDWTLTFLYDDVREYVLTGNMSAYLKKFFVEWNEKVSLINDDTERNGLLLMSTVFPLRLLISITDHVRSISR